MSESHPASNEAPKTKQIAEFAIGMKAAALAIGKALGDQDRRMDTTRIEQKTYQDGSESEVEVWDVPGQQIDLNGHTQSGLFPPRGDGTTDLRRSLLDPPDHNGRSAIIFDNGKSAFVQDGVMYIFGPKGSDGQSPSLRQVAIDEMPPVMVGARDSFWVTGIGTDGNPQGRTDIIGKPIAVAVETLRQ